MSKSSLRVEQMNAAVIEEAAGMARELVSRESRGPGDTENAMRRVESKFGVPYATLWALRYRKPKDIMVGTFLRLAGAYEAQRQEQLKRLEHERAITKVTGRLASYLVAASDALGRPEDRGAE